MTSILINNFLDFLKSLSNASNKSSISFQDLSTLNLIKMNLLDLPVLNDIYSNQPPKKFHILTVFL